MRISACAARGDFFPSVKEHQIASICKHVFYFPPAVAELLAKLCCRHGRLVQGAAPSTYVANLLFHSFEPELAERMEARGLNYRRFTDDLCVSSPRRVTPHVVNQIVCEYLNVDCRNVSIRKQERKRVRATMREIEMLLALNDCSEVVVLKLRSVSGRIARIVSLHPEEGRALKRRLLLARNALKDVSG